MSFDIDVVLRRGDRSFACRIAPEAGLTVLFGPSGAGKTTVLNMIAGLVPPDRGHVRARERTLFDSAAGVDLPVARRQAGYVFQEPRLFPHLRVASNLRYGARRAAREGALIGFDEAVALLELAPLLDRWPRTLSGGEARRVAIGRALLSGARFMLLDEPMSSLDRDRREEVMRIIERLRDELALPMLMVTHDPGEVERLAATIVAM